MHKLTNFTVKALKRAGRHSDGCGLYLVIKLSGTRSWVFLYQLNGRRREMGLGPAHVIGLADARQMAAEARKQVQAGLDPIDSKKASQSLLASIPTFRDAATRVHGERKLGWRNPKHRAQWLSTLDTYAFPVIGSLPIDKVASAHIRDLLASIWTSKPETARRVFQRVQTVLDWGYAKGFRAEGAPVKSVMSGLPKQTKRPGHFASLPYERVPSFWTKLTDNDSVGRLALRFLLLTAARSGEVRGATWEEIDFAGALWTIPADRMKAQKEHVVPLSDAAIAVLRVAEGLRKGRAGEAVFPGSGGKPLSDMTMLKAMRMATGGVETVHGLRSSFRVWAAHETRYPFEAAEAALAHTISSKTVKAYLQTDYLPIRRTMMSDWAAFVRAAPR